MITQLILTDMDHIEIKSLLNFLENNKEKLTRLQNEFVMSVKNQYRLTGLLTSNQMDSLLLFRERVHSYEAGLLEEPDFVSSLYSQLHDTYIQADY